MTDAILSGQRDIMIKVMKISEPAWPEFLRHVTKLKKNKKQTNKKKPYFWFYWNWKRKFQKQYQTKIPRFLAWHRSRDLAWRQLFYL